jgi:glutamine synthetase
MVEKIAALAKDLLAETDALDVVTEKAAAIEDAQEQANSYCADVIGAMNTLRATADELETIVGKEYWPYPIYEDLLFYV